jgi:hypothetical protein
MGMGAALTIKVFPYRMVQGTSNIPFAAILKRTDRQRKTRSKSGERQSGCSIFLPVAFNPSSTDRRTRPRHRRGETHSLARCGYMLLRVSRFIGAFGEMRTQPDANESMY